MNEHKQHVESIREAERIYVSSLLQGKWLGSEGQAFNIYDRFLDRIEKEQLAIYQKESKNEYEYSRQKRHNSGTIYMIPLSNWIYAKKVIEHCISKRIKLVK